MAIKVRGPAVAGPIGPNATVGTDIFGVFAKGREKQMAEAMKDALDKMERENVAYAAQVELVQAQTEIVAAEIKDLQKLKFDMQTDFTKRGDKIKEFNARETNDMTSFNATKNFEAQKKSSYVPGTKAARGGGQVDRDLGVSDDMTAVIGQGMQQGAVGDRTPAWDSLKNIQDTSGAGGYTLPRDQQGSQALYGKMLDGTTNELVQAGMSEESAYEVAVNNIPADMKDDAIAGYNTRRTSATGGGTSGYRVDLERDYEDITAATLDDPNAPDMTAIDARLAELYAKDLVLPNAPDSDRITMARDEFQEHYGSGKPARYQEKRGTESLLKYIKKAEGDAFNLLLLEVDNPTQSDIDTVTRAAKQDAIQKIKDLAAGRRPALPAPGPPTMEVDGETFVDLGAEDIDENVIATPIVGKPVVMPEMEIKGEVAEEPSIGDDITFAQNDLSEITIEPPVALPADAKAEALRQVEMSEERRLRDAEVSAAMQDRALELEMLDMEPEPTPIQLDRPPATEDSREALDRRIAEQLRESGPETVVKRPQGPGAGEYADNLPDPVLLEEPSLEVKPAQTPLDRDIELEMLEMPESELAPSPIVLPKKQKPKTMSQKDSLNKAEAAVGASQMLLNELEIERELATPYGKIVSQLVALDSTNDPEYVISRISEAYDDDFDVAKKATTLAFVLMNQKAAKTKLVE